MNSKAWRDLLEWNLHVEKRRSKEIPDRDYFPTLEKAKERALDLITDFKDEPESSVVTVFEYEDGFQIDAITDHPEFELYSDQYEPEDVIALVFYREGKRVFKRMR